MIGSRLCSLRAGLLLPLMLLAGCHRQPVGQVVAVVAGDEITRAESHAELRGAGDAGPDAARAALGRLVERRLLAKIARDQALDRSQDYLIRARQLNDALLAELLREQIAQALPAPSAEAVTGFIRANPATFPSSMSEGEARALAARIVTASLVEQTLRQRLAGERARTPIAFQPAVTRPPG